MDTLLRALRLCCISSGLFIFCCLLSPNTPADEFQDQEDIIELGSVNIIRYSINRDFNVRGWKLAPKIYFGNAKVNGKWGLGLIVDQGSYVFGLNNSQATVLIRY